MPNPSIGVFLSSTSDLVSYRDRVATDLRRVAGFHCIRFEEWGARDASVLTLCEQTIRSADIVVLLVGYRYGSSPEGRAESYTELEHDCARQLGKPVLILVLDGAPEAGQVNESGWERQKSVPRAGSA